MRRLLILMVLIAGCSAPPAKRTVQQPPMLPGTTFAPQATMRSFAPAVVVPPPAFEFTVKTNFPTVLEYSLENSNGVPVLLPVRYVIQIGYTPLPQKVYIVERRDLLVTQWSQVGGNLDSPIGTLPFPASVPYRVLDVDPGEWRVREESQ